MVDSPAQLLTTGDVVLTSDTGSTVTLADGWEQLDDGEITDVEPAKGHFGTEVTISGTNLLGGADDLASITLAGETASYTAGSGSKTEVAVVAPESANAGTAGDVVLTAKTGATITAEDAFTFVEAGNITLVEPAKGQEGTVIEINGTGLLGGGASLASVTLADVEVKEITIGDDEEYVVVVADGSDDAGAGDIVLTADTGAIVTLEDGFTYVADQVIELIKPAKGQLGTLVTISGTSLLGGGDSVATLTLAGVDAGNITSESNTEIVVEIADSTADTGAIVITSDTGAVVTTNDSAWEYLENGAITSISPSSGQHKSAVTIIGERMLGGGSEIASLTLAGLTANVKSENDTYITIEAAAQREQGHRRCRDHRRYRCSRHTYRWLEVPDPR